MASGGRDLTSTDLTEKEMKSAIEGLLERLKENLCVVVTEASPTSPLGETYARQMGHEMDSYPSRKYEDVSPGIINEFKAIASNHDFTDAVRDLMLIPRLADLFHPPKRDRSLGRDEARDAVQDDTARFLNLGKVLEILESFAEHPRYHNDIKRAIPYIENFADKFGSLDMELPEKQKIVARCGELLGKIKKAIPPSVAATAFKDALHTGQSRPGAPAVGYPP